MRTQHVLTYLLQIVLAGAFVADSLYALLDHLHHTVALIRSSRQHNLHDTLLLGIVSQGCRDAYAIGSALVFADGFGIEHLHSLFEHGELYAVAQVVLYLLMEEEESQAVRCVLLLLEEAGVLASPHSRRYVAVLLVSLLRGQGAQILAEHRAQGIDIYVAYKVELEVGCVGKTLLVDIEDAVVVQLIDILHSHTLVAYIITIHHTGNTVLQGCLRVHIHVLQLVFKAGQSTLVGLVIAMRSGKAEVGELHHRLQVLFHATARQSLCTVEQSGIHTGLDASQSLLKLRSSKAAPTAQANHWRIVNEQIFIVGVQTAAAPAAGSHADLIGGIVGLQDMHANAVAQGDELCAIDVCTLLLHRNIGA